MSTNRRIRDQLVHPTTGGLPKIPNNGRLKAFPGKARQQIREMDHEMRKLLAVAALSGAGLMAGIGTAWAETPAPMTGIVKGFTTAYSSPTNQSKVMYHLQPGTEVDTHCLREGQVLEGNPQWLIINAQGASAYVHAYQISTLEQPPHC
jgi:hypothetical protein